MFRSGAVPARSKGLAIFSLGLLAVSGLAGLTPALAATADPPTNVVGTSTGADQITVTWTAPVNTGGGTITGYAVYAFSYTGSNNPEVVSATNSAVIGGLTPGAYYVFTVTDWNGSGWSGWSNWSGWVLTGPIPTPSPSPSPSGEGPTIYLDGSVLAHNKTLIAAGNSQLKSELNTVVSAANGDLSAGPWSVMNDNDTPPSGTKHDYLSYPDYWWPTQPVTSSNPFGCPWQHEDGHLNPANVTTAKTAKGTMAAAVHDLSVAWYFTGNAAYAQRAELDLRTWFLNPSTSMNPNLNFAQYFPCGTPASEEPGIGNIDWSEVSYQLLDGLAILDSGAPGWTSTDTQGMHSWYSQFANWLTSSTNGLAEQNALNNHADWYDAELSGIYLYLGQTPNALNVVQGAEQRRIDPQIKADGSLPEELARTRPYHYSNFAISALCQLASVGRHMGLDLWTYRNPSGAGIQTAADFLIPAATKGQSAWPYPEPFGFSQHEAYMNLKGAATFAGDSKAAAAIAGGSVPVLTPSTFELLPICFA